LNPTLNAAKFSMMASKVGLLAFLTTLTVQHGSSITAATS